MSELPVLVIVGPTAVGKSALAMALAQRLGGEIVNADSMQLYRGMDIGTAKVDAADRAAVAHHVLDIWPVTQAASVADYQTRARAAIADVQQRGRRPILAGGSGLYIQSAVDPLEIPGTDPQIRSRLEQEAAEEGPEVLHRRLFALDPAAAAANSPRNARRIIRALEVIELTGRPFSDGPGMAAYKSIYPRLLMLGLFLDLPILDARIDRRVDDMWRQGLVDEVRDLEQGGLRTGVTARRALGYQQVLAFLAGECTEAHAKSETARATRRFVRRQLSWFRRDPRIQWIEATADPLTPALTAALAATGDQPKE
ncbi:MAG: tRNA (adenosine(37)-N6)-dimethylallyltransferase MiaA [Actinomycetota bacterium]